MKNQDIIVDINIANNNWKKDFPNLQSLCKNAINIAVKIYCPIKFREISLLFTDNAQMQSLNKQYRNKYKPTNVLAFSQLAQHNINTDILGDIIFAYEIIIDEAKANKKNSQSHLTHLLIHGFLHLQGMDHQNEEQANQMQALEIMILKELNIANPYIMEKQ